MFIEKLLQRSQPHPEQSEGGMPEGEVSRAAKPLKETFENLSFYPISALGSSRLSGTRNTQGMSAVKILARLELEKN